MNESSIGPIGRMRVLSSLAFLLFVGLSFLGCSGDDSDQAKRTGAGQTFCSPDLEPCGNACVNLASDVAHCGDCSSACDAGDSCVSGACAPGEQAETGGSSASGTGAGGGTVTGGSGTGGASS
jgi:hypothetical protein